MKHEILQSQLRIDNEELILIDDLENGIACQLVYHLAEDIIKNKLYKLTRIPEGAFGTTLYHLSLGVINPDDFITLRKIIERYNFQFVDEHNKISNLKELL